MVGAGLPRAQHAGGAPDRRQAEILGLAGAHPDLVPQSVVDHGVALLAGRDGDRTHSDETSAHMQTELYKHFCSWSCVPAANAVRYSHTKQMITKVWSKYPDILLAGWFSNINVDSAVFLLYRYLVKH